MRIEDKRLKVLFYAMSKGNVFQFVDIPELEDKYFLMAEDEEIVDIATGDMYCIDYLHTKYCPKCKKEEINVTLLNAKLVIE